MRKFFMFAFLLVFSLILPAQDAAPKMVIDHSIFDAGTVLKGALVEHDFIIKNEGNAVLEIKSAKPG